MVSCGPQGRLQGGRGVSGHLRRVREARGPWHPLEMEMEAAEPSDLHLHRLSLIPKRRLVSQ